MNVHNFTMSRNDGPARIGIHGPEGVGKTLLAAYFPAALFVGPERGIPRDLGFSVPELHPSNWNQMRSIVRSLISDEHDFQTLVIDTVDWIEPMIHEFVCERDSERKTEMNKSGHKLLSIEDYGYGRGYLCAEEEFRALIRDLDVLQHRRAMHVVLVMHSKVSTFKNPAGADFDRWTGKPQQRITDIVKEWVENLVFIHYRVDASKVSEDKERNKAAPDRARAKGVGGSDRVYGLRQCAVYDAKNRVGLPNEIENADPNELVTALLGGNLAPNHEPIAPVMSRDRLQPRNTNGAAPSPEPVAVKQTAAVTPASSSAPPPPKKTTNGTNGRPVPVGTEGLPANHEARQADEAERVNDTFARARETVAQRDADRAQREMGEPTPPPVDGELKAALERASKITAVGENGKTYRQIVEEWVSKAKGNPNNIKKIITRIDEDVRRYSAQQ